jgi:hypothetical protein
MDAEELRPPPIGTDVAMNARNGSFLFGLIRSRNKATTPTT